MAAGLGFKTFVTGDVLTAGDTNGYLMQGVLVFATAAARDSAITSPQEGQTCYLKDTDAVMTYSGSAWVAVGGSGGMTLINTGGTALSGASVTLSSIPSTYKHLLVLLENYYTATGDGATFLRFNSDTGNNYNSNRIRNINSTVQGQSFNAASSMQINTRTITTNTTLQTAFSAVNIYRYTDTTPNKNVTYTSGATETTSAANLQVVTGMGTYSGTSAISSLTVYADSNFSGGTIYLYGVN